MADDTDTIPTRPGSAPTLRHSFGRFLGDEGKDRGGTGGDYRRNAAHELERFAARVDGMG